jgi:hypothetical protein
MTTKLTITIDDSVIATAKKYAKSHGKSLSAIIENYLKSISTKDKQTEKISPKILKLMGSVSLPADFDYKKELSESLSKKYLK